MTVKQSHKTKKTPAKQEPISAEVDIFEPSPLETELLPVNPLLQSPIISVGDETEQLVEVVSKHESLTEANNNYKLLKNRSTPEVGVKNIELIKKLQCFCEETINLILDRDIQKYLKKALSDALKSGDIKAINAIKDLVNSIVMAMDKTKPLLPESNGLMGESKKQKINFMFKSSGTVQGAIQIDNSDDE